MHTHMRAHRHPPHVDGSNGANAVESRAGAGKRVAWVGAGCAFQGRQTVEHACVPTCHTQTHASKCQHTQRIQTACPLLLAITVSENSLILSNGYAADG